MDYSNDITRKGRVFNIQKYNTYDGPGVRTMVFFKGCPLRCKWCSNPEGLTSGYSILYDKEVCASCLKCVSVCPVGIHQYRDGEHIIDRNRTCIGCKHCETACYNGGIRIMGQDMSVEEIIDIVEEDSPFYQISGGGMTIGGGEVLMQPEFATRLLKACKDEWINTAIETSGFVDKETLLKVARYVDLFLYDIKHIDSAKHKQWTGVSNEKVLDNFKTLMDQGYKVKVRMPLLKGVNDLRDDIEALAKLIRPYRDYDNFEGVDMLPYHKLGVNKYRLLDMDYPMKGDHSLSENELAYIKAWIESYDLAVKIILH